MPSKARKSKAITRKTNQPVNVAIACQGGGSHTAFTAGVLCRLLTGPEHGNKFRIMALSGTSGGALCAGIAWSSLLPPAGKVLTPAQLQRMGREAAETLEALWMDVACGPDNPVASPFPFGLQGPFDYMDMAANEVRQWPGLLNPFFEFQCNRLSQLTRDRMEEFFARHMPVDRLAGKDLSHPKLCIGATNICEGWTDPIDMAEAITKAHSLEQFHRVLLASASIPPLFLPTQVNGEWYWDGLYSHNPPVECLANPADQPNGRPAAEDIPDEIWVIQINPEKSAQPPRTAAELIDRRNELTGNLTLLSELYHIDAMNWLIARGRLHGYKEIKLRRVRLEAVPGVEMDFASKYNRSREFIKRLLAQGRKKAPLFFDNRSVWTMGDIPGVHNTTFSGGRRKHGFNNMPKLGEAWQCTSLCPQRGICQTFPLVGPVERQLFDIGQHCFEVGVPPHKD